MLTGITAEIRNGYTGADHLIDADDRAAATAAIAGKKFRRASDAIVVAGNAFLARCDSRVRTARVQVQLRTAAGDLVTVG